MKKHKSKAGEPRGRIVAGLGHIDLGGITIPGRWPVLLVTLRNSAKGFFRFKCFCRDHGLVFKVAGAKEEAKPSRPKGFEVVYEVKGGPALEELLEQSYVVRWCYPLSVSAPHFNSSTYRR